MFWPIESAQKYFYSIVAYLLNLILRKYNRYVLEIVGGRCRKTNQLESTSSLNLNSIHISALQNFIDNWEIALVLSYKYKKALKFKNRLRSNE